MLSAGFMEVMSVAVLIFNLYRINFKFGEV